MTSTDTWLHPVHVPSDPNFAQLTVGQSVNISGSFTIGTGIEMVYPKEFRPGRLIAMHGDYGSGKDTVGAYLQDKYGFNRLAFADKLKLMCEDLDPIVHYTLDTDPDAKGDRLRPYRLTEAVQTLGWDRAKQTFPEVRRTQQRLATEVVRAHVDPDYWVKFIEQQMLPGGDYVITDLRFPNEYAMIEKLGGTVWWIQRPGHDYGADEQAKAHISEAWHPPKYCLLINDYDLDELYAKIDVGMAGGGFAAYEILGDTG